MELKYLHWGLALAAQAHTGVPVCLGSICTVSTADQSWISVVLNQKQKPARNQQ